MSAPRRDETTLPKWAQDRLAKLRQELSLDPKVWGDDLIVWAVQKLRDEVLREETESSRQLVIDFEAPGRREGLRRKREARVRAEAKNEALIQVLIPIAEELAYDAGSVGITAAHLRQAAERQNIRPESTEQRAWSFLPGLFARLVTAGRLLPTGRWRRSHIPESHGTRHVVYVHFLHAGEPR